MEKTGKSLKNRMWRAFTLIELLVVVGIITILAAIAVPNFLEAQMRTKVSRMKNDMRAMSVAIETYYVDNNHYPLRRNTQLITNNPWSGDSLNSSDWVTYFGDVDLPEKKTSTDPHYQASQLSRLTTPIAYMSNLYVDLFATHDRYPDNLIDYWDPIQTTMFINCAPNLLFGTPETDNYRIHRPSEAGYMIVSVGPDTYLGTRFYNEQDGWVSPPGGNHHPYGYTMYRPYDPSNGTVSAGNIYLAPQLGGLDGTPLNLTNRKLMLND